MSGFYRGLVCLHELLSRHTHEVGGERAVFIDEVRKCLSVMLKNQPEIVGIQSVLTR